jgi:hypothetical protein
VVLPRTWGVAAHQTRLGRVQPQPEPGKALGQDLQDPPGIRLGGEDQRRVIGIADEARRATQPRSNLAFEPLVQHVVQVDIGQQRRNYATDTKGNFVFDRTVTLDRSQSVLDMRRKR